MRLDWLGVEACRRAPARVSSTKHGFVMRILTLSMFSLTGCTPDSSPDTETTTEPTALKDKDGDGSPKTEDCDDRDASRFPGNVEQCDSIDNDCDDLVDEDAVDQVPLYADGDDDGVGAGDSVGVGCSAGEGLATVAGDCDDADASRAPHLIDFCDGIDNDCTEIVDRDVVPRDHPTLAAAMVGATSTEICVYPGLYDEPLGSLDRDVLLTAAYGPDVTELALGDGTSPWATLAGGTHLTVTGFGVTGLDATTVGAAEVQGAFVHADPTATLTLQDVVFHDNAVHIGKFGEGFLIYGEDALVELSSVEVHDLTVDYSGPTPNQAGVFLAMEGGELQVDGLVARDWSVSAGPTAGFCHAYGQLLYLSAVDAVLNGLEAADIDVSLECATDANVIGLLLSQIGGSLSVSEWNTTDLEITLTADNTLFDGLLKAVGVAPITLNELAVDRNTVSLVGDYTGFVLGLIHIDEGEPLVNHLHAYGNTLTVRDTEFAGYALGGVLKIAADAANLQWIDLRGNTLEGQEEAVGTGIYGSVDELTVTNAIFAGNVARATRVPTPGDISDASAAGLHNMLGLSDSSWFRITNADFVGNRVYSSDVAVAAGLRLTDASGESGADAPAVTIRNVSFVGNSIDGLGCWSPGGVSVPDDNLFFEYSDVFDNYTCLYGTEFEDELVVEGVDGILSTEPLYTDRTSDDPAGWDLTLATGSALIDAGSPLLLDADGSAADIGAYGGVWGDSW